MKQNSTIKIFVGSIFIFSAFLGCNLKEEESKHKNDHVVFAKPIDERDSLIGYWKLNNQPNEGEVIVSTSGVAQFLRFSNSLVGETKLYILDYCSRMGAVRTQFEIKNGSLFTGIVLIDSSVQESVNPGTLAKAPHYQPVISKVSSNTLLLDGNYEYSKFETTTELNALGDKSESDLCNYLQ